MITGDVQSSEAQAAIAKLQQPIAADGAVLAADAGDAQHRTARPLEVDAFFKGDPSTDAAFQGIRDLRSTIVPDGVRRA